MLHRVLAYRTREPVAESYLVALNLHIGMRLGIGMNHAQIPGLIVSRWRGFDAFRHDEKMRVSGSSCIALVVVVRRQAAGRDSCSHTRTTRPATVRQPQSAYRRIDCGSSQRTLIQSPQSFPFKYHATCGKDRGDFDRGKRWIRPPDASRDALFILVWDALWVLV